MSYSKGEMRITDLPNDAVVHILNNVGKCCDLLNLCQTGKQFQVCQDDAFWRGQCEKRDWPNTYELDWKIYFRSRCRFQWISSCSLSPRFGEALLGKTTYLYVSDDVTIVYDLKNMKEIQTIQSYKLFKATRVIKDEMICFSIQLQDGSWQVHVWTCQDTRWSKVELPV